MSETLIWSIGFGLLGAMVLCSLAYLRDMDRAFRRVRGTSTVIRSDHGDIEYTESGRGGHLLLAVEQDAIRSAVLEYVRSASAADFTDRD
jgi:hypothetical protein